MFFWFKLAAHLKCGTVHDLQTRMTAEEFGLWMAFHDLQPFGEDWQDYRGALMAAQIVAPHTKTALKVEKFLPFQRPKRKQTPKEQYAVLMQGLTAMKKGP